MEIQKLDARPNLEFEKKLKKQYVYFEELIVALKKKEIPTEQVCIINQHIEDINLFQGSNKALRKHLRKSRSKLLTLLEKELKLVTKGHYLALYMVMGMLFGVALGTSLGVSLGIIFGNMGLPLGMALGIALGARADKKALADGRQLDVEIRY